MIPLKFDLMFKKVFGNNEDKMPLKELLKCILDIEAKEITILNPEIIGSSYYDKRTIVDLIVELEDGTKIAVEMNTNVNKYLIDRNVFYMFKIMSKDMKKGNLYSKLNKHIQINIDCEGYHKKPIMKYKLIEEECSEVLTDKIEIIRVDLPFYVEKCYNLDASKLDYKDRFIGLIGIEDRNLASKIIKGDMKMEDIYKKVEDFSDDEEILGAYDAEWHKIETERVVMLDKLEKAEEEGLKQGFEEGTFNEKNAIARNMLKENVDIEFISKVTGLNIDQIEKLGK